MLDNANATKLRIVIADDHPSIRENLRYLLNAEADFEVVDVAKDGLADYDGLSVARALRRGRSTARVILLADSAAK